MDITSELKNPRNIAIIIVAIILSIVIFRKDQVITTTEKQYSAQIHSLDSTHVKDSTYNLQTKYTMDSLYKELHVMNDSINKSSATINGKTVIKTHVKTINKDGSSTESDQTEIIDTGKIITNYVQVIHDSVSKEIARKLDSVKALSVAVHDTVHITKRDTVVSYKENTKIVAPAEKKLSISAGIEGGYSLGNGFSSDLSVTANYQFKDPFYVQVGVEHDGMINYTDPKQYVLKTGAGIAFSF